MNCKECTIIGKEMLECEFCPAHKEKEQRLASKNTEIGERYECGKKTIQTNSTVEEALRKALEQIKSGEELGIVGYAVQYDERGNLLELKLTRDYMDRIVEDGYDQPNQKRSEKTRKKEKVVTESKV